MAEKKAAIFNLQNNRVSRGELNKHCYISLSEVAIVTGLMICSVSGGYVFGQMSGMIDALRGVDSGLGLGEDDVSWIAATINATCVCGFAVGGLITEKLGRRRSIVLLSLPVLGTWIMLYYATGLLVFIVSRILAGISYGGLILLTYVSIVEYSTPSRRAVGINVIAAVGPEFGAALGHILSILLHWRTVALLGIIPTGLSVLFPLFWMESPSWLASKGRFDECEEAFRKLHGNTDVTEAELRLLVSFEQAKQKKFAKKQYLHSTAEKLAVALRQKYFWKVMTLCLVVSVYRVAGGRVLYNTMAITILQEMTGSSNILLFMLLVDGLIIIGSVLSCFFINTLRLRTLLLRFGLVSNTSLVVLSGFLYCAPRDNVYFAWLSTSILAFYFIVSYAGPYAVLEILLAEIFPLEFKSFLTFAFGGFAGLATFLSVKLAPAMFSSMGYHGVFLINSAISYLCLVYLWMSVPETKGRTMQEIELFFRHGKYADNKHTSNFEQSESLFISLA